MKIIIFSDHSLFLPRLELSNRITEHKFVKREHGASLIISNQPTSTDKRKETNVTDYPH